MIEIKVNDEVRDVKAELAMGLTGLQMFFVFCGIASGFTLGFSLYMLTPLSLTVCAYAAIVPAIPFALLAFKEWHEMNAAQVARIFVTRIFIDPKIKTYEGENAVYMQEKKLLAAQAKIEAKMKKEAAKKAKKEARESGSN